MKNKIEYKKTHTHMASLKNSIYLYDINQEREHNTSVIIIIISTINVLMVDIYINYMIPIHLFKKKL